MEGKRYTCLGASALKSNGSLWNVNLIEESDFGMGQPETDYRKWQVYVWPQNVIIPQNLKEQCFAMAKKAKVFTRLVRN